MILHAENQIITSLPIQPLRMDEPRVRPPPNDIGTFSTIYGVSSSTPQQGIHTIAAIYGVLSRASMHLVVSTSRVNQVTAFASVYKIIAPVCTHGVVASKCVDLVIFPRANELVRVRCPVKTWHRRPSVRLTEHGH